MVIYKEVNDETETGEVVQQEACVAGRKSNRIFFCQS